MPFEPFFPIDGLPAVADSVLTCSDAVAATSGRPLPAGRSPLPETQSADWRSLGSALSVPAEAQPMRQACGGACSAQRRSSAAAGAGGSFTERQRKFRAAADKRRASAQLADASNASCSSATASGVTALRWQSPPREECREACRHAPRRVRSLLSQQLAQRRDAASAAAAPRAGSSATSSAAADGAASAAAAPAAAVADALAGSVFTVWPLTTMGSRVTASPITSAGRHSGPCIATPAEAWCRPASWQAGAAAWWLVPRRSAQRATAVAMGDCSAALA